MLRRTARRALIATAMTTAVAVAPVSTPAMARSTPPTELLGKHGPVVPLKNAAMVSKSKWGLVYKAGQQDSRLTVTYSGGRVHFRDTGTKKIKSLAKPCRKENAAKGIAISCKIAKRYNASNPTFLQIWPRLGDDHVDASRMPAMFRMWVLADAGRDVVRTGAGDDFVNGAQDSDVVYGGAGDDWLRTGLADDRIYGQDGDDELVGVDGSDTIFGGAGDDRVGGGPGRDQLRGESGADTVACGSGPDNAWTDARDRVMRDCESVSRY